MQLIGCGILKREIALLAERNGWAIEADYLPPVLHVDPSSLEKGLREGLARHPPGAMVFYGQCHPGMDRMVSEARAFRSRGQNCIEMLLGPDRYMREAEAGAFFLLEAFAEGWDEAILRTFGGNPEIAAEILGLSCRHFLCLRTPCSGDYSAKAGEISQKTGLPLVWTDVRLDHLESVMKALISAAAEGPAALPAA